MAVAGIVVGDDLAGRLSLHEPSPVPEGPPRLSDDLDQFLGSSPSPSRDFFSAVVVRLPCPGTQGKRKALAGLIGYLEPRLDMMRYAECLTADLVIASGQAEGVVRHVVGERLDCSGMRWTRGKTEALLQLRCIELNGDWGRFMSWASQRHQ